VKVGGKARTSFPSSVADADRADLMMDVSGRPVTAPYANPENLVSGKTSDITDTTSTSLLGAPGSGLKNHVTQLVIQNSHASQGTWVNILDGSGGTAIYTIYCPPGGGGASITFPAPLRQPTANTALHVQCGTSSANVRASASGYKAP
jgi:hypothetical protein